MLGYARYLEAIGDECAQLSEALQRSPDVRVPSCPEWTISDLIEHMSWVYRFWATQLLAGDPDVELAVPKELRPEITRAELEFEETVLIDRLSLSPEDAPCWNWSGEDFTALWVARRMALETAIHRVDAQLTGGNASPITADLSLDGIDEKLEVHLRNDLRENRAASLSGTICLICSDVNGAWTLSAERGRLRVRSGRGPASVALVGTASDLFRFVWNRVGLEAFEVTGDRSVALNWRQLPS